MLIPAIAKKKEIEELFARNLYNDNMFLYVGCGHCNYIPDLKPEDGVYDWAIVDKTDNVVGYFSYRIVTYTESVQHFRLISFASNPIIGIDVYRKMKELVSTYHRIEWCMVGGNPVEAHYDKFCARYGGRKLKLQDATKDSQGMFRDMYIYEIIK